MLIDCSSRHRRAAVVQNGVLTDLYIDRLGPDRSGRLPLREGAVCLGRVVRVMPALHAAFIDLGGGLEGYLAQADIRPRPEPGARIGQCLRGGALVLVQVKSEGVGGKEPVLTMDIAFSGRFLVRAPFAAGVAMSRRLGVETLREAARERLAGLGLVDGWIARAGVGKAEDGQLTAEAGALNGLWQTVAAAAARGGRAGVLWPGHDAARRALVDRGIRPLDTILLSDAAEADTLGRWCAAAAPELAGRLRRVDDAHLFDRHDLEGRIAALCQPRVPLPDGGSLMIEPTEAMTVVDVNGGNEGNALTVNLRAAEEIARQIRLRHLGGIIVVDFVSMGGRTPAGGGGSGGGGAKAAGGRRRDHGERLLAALRTAVSDDPAPVQIYGLSRLGLVEMTRTRRGPSLTELLAGGGAGAGVGAGRAEEACSPEGGVAAGAGVEVVSVEADSVEVADIATGLDVQQPDGPVAS